MWKYEKRWVVDEAENVAFDFGPSSVEIRVGEKVLKLPVQLERTADGKWVECIVYATGAQWAVPYSMERIEKTEWQRINRLMREAFYLREDSRNQLTIVSG